MSLATPTLDCAFLRDLTARVKSIAHQVLITHPPTAAFDGRETLIAKAMTLSALSKLSIAKIALRDIS